MKAATYVLILTYIVLAIIGDEATEEGKGEHGTGSNTSHQVNGAKKSITPKFEKKLVLRLPEVPSNAVMYLSFDAVSKDKIIVDGSGNKNNARFEKSAALSARVLGTCGKAAEINHGSITWSGTDFKHKPEKAISIAMWVKVKKSGVINWFANGKKGQRMFYTKTKGTVVPAKVWTHVAGTFDSKTGLARIYINGDLEQEAQQTSGKKLPQNWLVNGIGSDFGDDSMHYVDELLVYDRALNTSEVRTLANRCIFNRMVLHFGFQSGNKTNVNDQSGLDNNGILTGGAALKSDCDRCGGCLDLQVGPEPSMKIQQISLKNLPRVKVSIAAWVNLNDTKGVHNIFKTESGKGNVGYQLQVKNGKIRWYIASDKGRTIFDNITKNEVVPEALWTHIIVSYNNENGRVAMYTNSLLKFKDTVPETKRKYLPINWDNDASIGDSSFHGYLDEFIMYNWELDNAEALYVRNYCADHPKLVRFTVRVPLTKKSTLPKIPATSISSKKTIVPKVENTTSIKRNVDWWAIYKKLLERRNRAKKSLTKLRRSELYPNELYPFV